jgi:hypothetical protein
MTAIGRKGWEVRWSTFDGPDFLPVQGWVRFIQQVSACSANTTWHPPLPNMPKPLFPCLCRHCEVEQVLQRLELKVEEEFHRRGSCAQHSQFEGFPMCRVLARCDCPGVVRRSKKCTPTTRQLGHHSTTPIVQSTEKDDTTKHPPRRGTNAPSWPSKGFKVRGSIVSGAAACCWCSWLRPRGMVA